MRILGSYVVFLIHMMGIILADHYDEHREFYEKVLELHNEYRAMHGADPLELDRELSLTAMEIAKAADVKYSPGDNETIGHNIFYDNPYNDLSYRNVVNSWYDQKKNYTYQEYNSIPDSARAFTQIVWKFTEYLGVAFYRGTLRDIIVATYLPPGNIVNEYMENVEVNKNEEGDSSSSSGINKQ